MRARLAAALAMALALGVATAAAAPAAAPLPLGHPVEATLAPGAMRAWRSEAPPGHVVQAVFEGHGATLDLQDGEGRHLRRLGHADGTPQEAMWVARAGERLLVQAAETPPGAAPARFTLQLTRTLAPAPAEAAPEATPPASPRLRALQQALAAGGDTGAFWQAMARDGTPLIESLADGRHALVTFLWRGDAGTRAVRLFGSPSGNHDPLGRLGASDVWFTTFTLPLGARLSYRLAPDVPRVQGSAVDNRRVILATAQRDPLNPRSYPAPAAGEPPLDAFQGHSVLALPQAPPQPWITPRPGVPRGTLSAHRITSRVLGNERALWAYRPAGGPPEALLVLFDAHAYRAQVPTPTIVDNLVADGLLPRTAVLLVANPSPEARATELPPNAPFLRFLDEELMPWAEREGLAQPAARTVIAGSSYGGLAAAHAGLRLPQRFGHVLSLSGSFWWSPEGTRPGWLQRQFADAPRQPLRFYLDAGRYEAARGGQDGILETSRHLGDVLRAKGYPVVQREHDTGHDYLHWRGSLGCGLVALLNPAKLDTLTACAGQALPGGGPVR